MSMLNSASLDSGAFYNSVVMGLAAPKRARPTDDEIELQRSEKSRSTSPIFGNVTRKRRSGKPVQLVGWKSKGLPALFAPEIDNPGSVEGLQSKKEYVNQRSDKSIPDVSISNNTESKHSSFRSSRGQRRCRLNSSQHGKLGSKTFEDFMEHIWSTCPGERRKLFSYLDSLWFHLYLEKSSKERVLNWVKKKDIFSKNYVLVPIVLWSHWSLLILCNFGTSLQPVSPCMLLLDSLQQTNPRRLEPGIRRFILDVYQVYKMPVTMETIQKIPFLIPKVPQQRNGEECGSFVLYYIHLFLENAPEVFAICSSEGYPYFGK